MSEATLTALGLALIVFLTTTVSSIIPLWWGSRVKREEWARQDAVAKQADEVAKKAAEAATLLLAANERVAKSSNEMNDKLDVSNGKLDEIHVLVNSKMTEEMQGRLDETIRGLASLEEIVSLKIEAGQKPSPEALGVIKAAKERIDELRARLDDRLKQQAIIDSKMVTSVTHAVTRVEQPLKS